VSGPIVIAAGGTGGHFFPAEALAAELLRRGRRLALMTDARSGGLKSPAFAGQDCFMISGRGVFGSGARHAVRSALALAAGTVQARRLLARLDAAVVVGFGGYPAVAPVLASRLLRRRPPVVLHDQNAVLGRANRLLARFADTLALSQPATARVPAGVRTVVTGNPVRPAVLAVAASPYEPPGTELRLLVLGGSLGARVFSDVVPAALALLPEGLRTRLSVTQQCRPEDLERVRTAYAANGIAAELGAFFADVAGLLARAHLVICRGGGSTVAELAVVGRPAIIVPLPIAIDDDQAANARGLVEAGGAWMVRQPEFTPDVLARRIATLAGLPAVLAAAAQAAAGCAIADAAARLADLVEAKITQDTVA
jgi:UDP-N-acetylglucosamine--N-acetylmuramyl-(pentapeptide) pyrophosphoryl-undecaprenol N-acetylglucosamine transferase